jgi:APA family basic amino acid/polyamine antiporter
MSNRAEHTTGAPTTKDLKRVLGFGSLMSVAVGQIIGAGIMSLMGIGIAMTGRSVVFSFIIAAVMVIFNTAPAIIVSGTIRLRGGQYTQTALLGGKLFGGINVIVYLVMNLSLTMYGLSFADYFLRFFPQFPRQAVAIGVMTIFWLLNMFGIDKMAKVQNIIVAVMCISLGLLAVFGISEVQPGYFEEGFLTGGITGMLQAAALLTFATGGAVVVLNLGAEAKNPVRDIPLVCIISTIAVAVLYGFIAVVASGVLPVEQVAGQPLTMVAEKVLPAPIFIFFMVGGAMFALATTLNSQFASSTKQMLQASVDGWFPQKLAYIHPRFKTPMFWLTFFYVVGIIPIITGLDIGDVANLVLIIQNMIGVIASILLIRLPVMVPDAWAASKFRMPRSALLIIAILSAAMCAFLSTLLLSSITPGLIIANVILLAGAILYCLWRLKTGKVNMEISYENS